jgi:hypothetical protein
MKKTLLAALAFGPAALAMACPGPALDPIAERLFRDAGSRLSVADKNLLAAKTGFSLSGNEALPFALDKDSRDHPFGASVLPTDMNGDGQEEIFIVYGNTYTSGLAGSSVMLFIKDPEGAYEAQFAFSGVTPDALATTNLGYPDLLIGGPGFQYPVWRWDGDTYEFDRTVPDAEYGRLEKRGVDELSRAYRGSPRR